MCACNVAVVAGRLSRPAEQRVLPSGERLVAIQVTVNRTGRRDRDGRDKDSGDKDSRDKVAGRAETVPVVWFDPPASAGTLDVEESVVVVGRVRRRFFQAGGSTQSRTEVVAEAVLPTRRVKSVRTQLAAAIGRLEATASDLEEGRRGRPEPMRRGRRPA